MGITWIKKVLPSNFIEHQVCIFRFKIIWVILVQFQNIKISLSLSDQTAILPNWRRIYILGLFLWGCIEKESFLARSNGTPRSNYWTRSPDQTVSVWIHVVLSSFQAFIRAFKLRTKLVWTSASETHSAEWTLHTPFRVWKSYD